MLELFRQCYLYIILDYNLAVKFTLRLRVSYLKKIDIDSPSVARGLPYFSTQES